MIDTYLYYFLAFLALGFLIFIHELGHFFMARHVGMKVESFGIGFGRAIYKWKHKGVEWRWNWLPFGGYVKIAGMELKKDEDPFSVPGGFFAKRPWDRIKVALAGPAVNILFAFLAFTVVWAAGGREKIFSDYTHIIGWVDPGSELYKKGVRPGDIIESYNGESYTSSKDNIIAPMTAGGELNVKGFKVDYKTGKKTPFDYTVKPYPNPYAIKSGILTSGILQPASQVIYEPSKISPKLKKFLPPSKNVGGIKPNDRIVWIDGVRIFSQRQLKSVINSTKALLTIQRGNQTFLRRVPMVPIHELKLNHEVKEELSDWQYESNLSHKEINDLYDVPYNLSHDGVVENRLNFIDEEMKSKIFPEHVYSENQRPLEKGDKIIAVDGVPVKKAYQLFYQLQHKKANVVVLREANPPGVLSASEADQEFIHSVNEKNLEKIASTIGTQSVLQSAGNLVLLEPIVPKKQEAFFTTPEEKADYQKKIHEQQQQIDNIENTELRERAKKEFEREKNDLILGIIGIQDQKVIYDPNPATLFMDVTNEMIYTLKALFTGALSPKWLSGPVGIVQAVQKSWQVSFMDGVFWVGLISLNLGYLNLLPIPVLDGGYVVLFLIEMVTRKRIKPQMLEKLIIPFFILLILFMIFVTYQDFSRIFNVFH